MSELSDLCTFQDLKRVEVFKLHNSSAFNLTGEILVENTNSYEWTTLRGQFLFLLNFWGCSHFSFMTKCILIARVHNFFIQSLFVSVLNFNRSIVSKWRTDSGTPYENIFHIILKPELWFSCHFKTNRTIRVSMTHLKNPKQFFKRYSMSIQQLFHALYLIIVH